MFYIFLNRFCLVIKLARKTETLTKHSHLHASLGCFFQYFKGKKYFSFLLRIWTRCYLALYWKESRKKHCLVTHLILFPHLQPRLWRHWYWPLGHYDTTLGRASPTFRRRVFWQTGREIEWTIAVCLLFFFKKKPNKQKQPPFLSIRLWYRPLGHNDTTHGRRPIPPTSLTF